ncbi:hypothetical protein KQJ09_15005, partial [Enterococcus sp. S109_ASV_20]
ARRLPSLYFLYTQLIIFITNKYIKKQKTKKKKKKKNHFVLAPPPPPPPPSPIITPHNFYLTPP